MTEQAATLARVAPELVAGLERLPEIDFSLGLEPYRSVLGGAALPPLPDALNAVSCTEQRVPGLEGEPDVRVLVYDPPGSRSAPRPAVLHMHGGGFVIGAPEMNDVANRTLVLEHNCVVVSVAYRLAPETTWAGSLADNHAAFLWLVRSADELAIDPARIALAGESAGGGHAAMLALHLSAQGQSAGNPPTCFLLLDAPMLDDRTCTSRDPHPHTGQLVWTLESNQFGWRALLGMEPGGACVNGAPVPARAVDLSGLPPTFISVGALDLFLEEGMEWVRRLARTGVATELHVIPGAYHGFTMAGESPQVRHLQQLRNAALARAFSCG